MQVSPNSSAAEAKSGWPRGGNLLWLFPYYLVVIRTGFPPLALPTCPAPARAGGAGWARMQRSLSRQSR